ncbi:MAG TPA: FAD-dependent oxidoreductase [Mycobacterium sp.]|nr:FAD-dependent oxidoreductase [Mycobacterium sp.]
MNQVIISGAGPNGLMLACELALAGVRPVVLEQLPSPSDEPKANGLVGQVIRSLDIRGLYEEFSGLAGPPQPMYAWIFAGLPVPLAELADNPMYGLPIPQPRLVRLLVDRARRIGVEIRWGHEVTGFENRDDGVVVTVSADGRSYDLHATYLVGADGGRSPVRKAAGIDFPGYTAESMVGRIAHVQIPQELRASDGGLDVPGFGHLPPMHNRLERGMVIFAELEPGRPLIGTMELDHGPVDDDVPLTLDELRASLRRVLGVDLPFAAPSGPGPHALRRINGQNTRQADRYRSGNVFLVGDAAHVHSAMGGPGLNLGLQDAMNLGWKLAAAVNGWAPARLLDTYHSERFPVGERVIMHSMSQTALMLPGPEITALRKLFGELLETRDAAAYIARLLAGSDVRYDVGDDHPLAGRFIPDTVDSRLLHDGHPVLLDATGGEAAEAVRGWQHRVDVVPAQECPSRAMLIRPDGYVAWAANDFGDAAEERLRTALQRWFGAENVRVPVSPERTP